MVRTHSFIIKIDNAIYSFIIIKYCLSFAVIIRDIVAKRLGIPVPSYTPQPSEPAVSEAAPTSQDPTTGEHIIIVLSCSFCMYFAN